MYEGENKVELHDCTFSKVRIRKVTTHQIKFEYKSISKNIVGAHKIKQGNRFYKIK